MDGTRKQKPMMKSELTKCKKSREQKARKTNGKTNQCILYILCLHRRGLDPRSPLCHWVLYDSLAGAAACGNPPCVTNSFWKRFGLMQVWLLPSTILQRRQPQVREQSVRPARLRGIASIKEDAANARQKAYWIHGVSLPEAIRSVRITYGKYLPTKARSRRHCGAFLTLGRRSPARAGAGRGTPARSGARGYY